MKSQSEIDRFELTDASLRAFHAEISALSRKSPNDAVNKFKLKFVNDALTGATAVLGTGPLEGFTRFDDESLPSNSDVVLVLAQYLSAFDRFRDAHTVHDGLAGTVWTVRGKQSEIESKREERGRN